MKITREIIGERLVLYRDELNMTQEFVSSKSGVSQNSLSKLEKNGRGSMDTLFKLLNYYRNSFDTSNFLSASFKPLEISEEEKRLSPSERIAELSREILQIAERDEI